MIQITYEVCIENRVHRFNSFLYALRYARMVGGAWSISEVRRKNGEEIEVHLVATNY